MRKVLHRDSFFKTRKHFQNIHHQLGAKNPDDCTKLLTIARDKYVIKRLNFRRNISANGSYFKKRTSSEVGTSNDRKVGRLYLEKTFKHFYLYFFFRKVSQDASSLQMCH